MTLDQLQRIVALARERNFRRAAEACCIEQPAMSISVRKLEDELGVALFERNNHTVRITPLGEQIVERAELAVREASALLAMAAAARAGTLPQSR